MKQGFIPPHWPWRNRMIERFIQTLKAQCVGGHRFESIRHAPHAICDRIAVRNNRHSSSCPAIRTAARAFGRAA
ncbi:integrase core domain-containing protein [Fluviibacterium sp. DFM31]|uniref:Integrase core domain-containing protein n=1 Tax=Meridianimarinicoccus marinus TaxID=3231483 RepID=A0ABV3LC03_9RHOB